jgi:2,4-dienoyl-CoA reductase-like NADH-dependent reductase (Old Yellow Enzyme family)
MEGWDGTTDGRPTELTKRRWKRFGLSGAKLIWGGEAASVCPDGRANPNQLMILKDTAGELADLRKLLVQAHEQRFGTSDDLLVGLQLTHSGRYSKPNDKNEPAPIILYHHPILDKQFGLAPDSPIMTDNEVASLICDFVDASVLAQEAGFDFVDIKHCHGYLGHEFLSAVNRPGRYGGSFENRTRFLREIVEGIRTKAPGLSIGVRLSAFDFIPFQSGKDGRGEPVEYEDRYPYAFGGDGTGLGIDLTEPLAFLDLLTNLGIELVCISASSGYYNPHLMKPAFLPGLGGYLPPEDPLVGVARLIQVTAELKRKRPGMIYVGSGYSYLQQWLPNVAQNVVRTGNADIIGIGRLSVSYPQIIADILAGEPLKRRLICRTCGNCTNAPRSGLVSGCFTLDEFYRRHPDYKQLMQVKRAKR